AVLPGPERGDPPAEQRAAGGPGAGVRADGPVGGHAGAGEHAADGRPEQPPVHPGRSPGFHPARGVPPGVLQPDPPRPRSPVPRLLHPRHQPARVPGAAVAGEHGGRHPAGRRAAGFQAAGLQAANALTSQADSEATDAYLRLFLVGGLGLVAIAISVALGLWIGRRLVRELSSLRETALELANERLPDVVSRLAAGEEVDSSPQAAPSTATSDEVRQVGEAFATVQQTAV